MGRELLLLAVLTVFTASIHGLTIGYQGVASQDLAQVELAAAAALEVLQNEVGVNNPIDNCAPDADYVSLRYNGSTDLVVDLSYTPQSAAVQPFVHLLLRDAQPNACTGKHLLWKLSFPCFKRASLGLDTVECLSLGPTFGAIATRLHRLLLAMGWTQAILIATATCSWGELATSVREGLLAPNSKVPLSLPHLPSPFPFPTWETALIAEAPFSH